MTPKTQSVCKHCGQLCDPNKPKYHIDYRYDGHDAEPISEPASTGEPRESLSVQKRKHYMKGGHAADFVPAARPSGPPAPQATTVTKQAATCNCYGNDIPHTHSAPQTSAEPYIGSDQERVFLEKKALGDFAAAPQPVPRADGPEHPIVGPEDGSPCCEHCAKHPGSQWTLKVSHPVSGDAPKVESACSCNPKPLNGQHWTGCQEGKVEEIAERIAQAVTCTHEGCKTIDILRCNIKRLSEAILRPYFPPASQTPELLAELKLLTVKDGKPGVAFERYTKLWGLLPAIINALGATPASTARTGAHKGDVMHIELKKYDLYLHGLATDHIWLMADGPDSHPIGIRLDCGDSGTVYLSRSQAKDLAEQLHELAAPGSVPQAASGWTVDEAENFKRLASEPQPKPTEHLIRAMGVPQAVESDVQLLINRRSNDEGELRHAWLTKHEHASSISFDQETGVPHHAIYEYPMSSIAQKETNRAFFGAVQHVRDQDTGAPQAEPTKEEK